MNTTSSQGPKWGQAVVYTVVAGVEIGMSLLRPPTPQEIAEYEAEIFRQPGDVPMIIATSTHTDGMGGVMDVGDIFRVIGT